MRRYSNNAVQTTLSGAVTAAATTITVSSVTGFPAADFVLALDYGTASQELVLVTGVGGTTLTVTRGYDNTTATSHDVGATVVHTHSAADFADSRSHEAATADVHGVTGALAAGADLTALDGEVTAHTGASTGVHGVTGDVVGTSDAQTLTNKTLDASSPTAFNPTGSILAFAGSAAPSGWLMCNGQAVSRSTYAGLFGVLGTAYGAGDGGTTFNVPNLTGRVPRGGTPGTSGGSDTVTLSTANLPAHTHTINHDHPAATTSSDGDHTHTVVRGGDTGSSTNGSIRSNVDASVPDGDTRNAGAHTHTVNIPTYSGNSGSTGSGSSVTVTNPYVGVSYIIKA